MFASRLLYRVNGVLRYAHFTRWFQSVRIFLQENRLQTRLLQIKKGFQLESCSVIIKYSSSIRVINYWGRSSLTAAVITTGSRQTRLTLER